MAADSADTEVGHRADTTSKRGERVRLLTLDDLDGRTLAARHVKDTRAEVIVDLGGEAGLSTLERAAVDHVSIMDALVKDAAARWLQGQDIELSAITSVVNTFNRTAAALGWQRRTRDVTPSIEQIARERA